MTEQAKVNKNELVAKLAAKINERLGEGKEITHAQAKAALDSLNELIIDELIEKGKLNISGFGTFKLNERSGYIQPKTREKLDGVYRNVSFSCGQTSRRRINEMKEQAKKSKKK